MEKTPIDPAEGLAVLTERLKYRGVRLRRHRDSWFGTLVGRIAYALCGKAFPTGDPTEHDWVICQTIGGTVWLPNNWDSCGPRIQFEILLHEERHSLDFERWGLGSMAFGVLTMGLFYLLVLPAVWTTRSWFERRAYEQSMRARFLLGDPPGKGFLGHMMDAFAGRSYFWMWPFPKRVEAWFWRAMVRMQHAAKSGV